MEKRIDFSNDARSFDGLSNVLANNAPVVLHICTSLSVLIDKIQPLWLHSSKEGQNQMPPCCRGEMQNPKMHENV